MTANPPLRDQPFSASILKEEVEALSALNQDLSELGINEIFAMSQIIVIGDRSTGKSSLIERISNFNMPKVSRLRTQCPIAINMSSGEAWKCSVSVEESYTYNTTVKCFPRARPMGPWEERPAPIKTSIGETRGPERLIDLIEMAQSLMLNPARNKTSSQEIFALESEIFSPNVIHLDISARSCPNLCLMDMPGCINSLPGRNRIASHVDSTSYLASKFASDKKNIVLLLLPSNHSVSNSRSCSVIRNQREQSHTMVVYTKADIAREEELKNLAIDDFDDEEKEFGYGHHVVMLRNSAGSAQDVQKVEDNFFAKSIWKDSPKTIKYRLGVPNLVDHLHKIVLQKTAATLASYTRKAHSRIMQIEEVLKQIPTPPEAAGILSQLDQLTACFGQNLTQLFVSNQTSTNNSCQSKLEDLMGQFKLEIQRDKPTLTFRSDLEQQLFKNAKGLIARNSRSTAAADDQQSTIGAPESSAAETRVETGQSNIHRGSYNFTLDEIMMLNRNYQSSSVRGIIEPKALEIMNLRSVQSWNASFHHHMQRVSELVHTEVLQCTRDSFSDLEHLLIYPKIVEFVREYLVGIIKTEQEHLQYLCDAETRHPLCSDAIRLRANAEEEYGVLRAERDQDRLKVEEMVQKSKGVPANGKKLKDLTIAGLDPDPWDAELTMAAKTSAYYQVVMVRFVDCVCQHIWASLVPKVGGEVLAKHVRRKLGLDLGEDRGYQAQLEIWMSANPETDKEKLNLGTELSKLQEVKRHIADASRALEKQKLSQLSNTSSDIQKSESTFTSDTCLAGGRSNSFVTPIKRTLLEADLDR